MTEENNIDQANPDSEIMNVVNSITDSQRSSAIDAIQDILYSRSNDALGKYKQTVAQTFFDQPEETEEPSNETDTGND
tara:strand:- start:442 stop:675 length:234 start_codon:yes stop_codon:yes gene_type:complete